MLENVYAMGMPVGGAEGGASTMSFFFPLIIIFVIFYFLIILPQKKEKKKMGQMRDSLKKGDKVVTAGGVHGIVANTKENTVVVKVDDNVKMEFSKSAISQVTKSS